MGIIRWGSGTGPIGRSERRAYRSLKLNYHWPLVDVLDWGPQHVDLATQRLLRRTYFRRPSPSSFRWEQLTDDHHIEHYLEAVRGGEELLFWCDPLLPACLAILWALDALATRGADLRKASLVISPADSSRSWIGTDAMRKAIAQRIPVPDLLDPLLAVRRHLASERLPVQADLSALPSPVREWAAVTDRLADFLPDRQGLDIIDEMLLVRLTEAWTSAAEVIHDLTDGQPAGHVFGEGRLWQRLMELSGDQGLYLRRPIDRPDALLEARFDGEAAYGRAFFRLAPLAIAVKNGRADVLKLRPFWRWVGGRLITNDNPIRRDTRRRWPRPAAKAEAAS